MTDVSGTQVTAQALIALQGAVVDSARREVPTSGLPGGFPIKRRGQGQVNADSRLYIHGDELRYIDKGATARTGDLHVRTFHEERDRVTFLVADFRPSMLWGMRRAFRSVAAAEALAWIGWQAVAAGGRVGLLAITTGEPIIVRTRSGTRGMLSVIGGLVRAHEFATSVVGPDLFTDPPLDMAVEGLHRIVPKGASIIIVSAFDQRGNNFEGTMKRLAQHRAPSFVVVEDSGLQSLPPGHYPIRSPDGYCRSVKLRQTPPRDHALPEIPGCAVMHLDTSLQTRQAMTQAGAS